MSFDLKKGSYNRLWAVLGALAYKGGQATLSELSKLSGLPRSSTEDVMKKVLDGQVPELLVKRESATFIVVRWGGLLTQEKLAEIYSTYCTNG
ncbi:helix-turn-helix domain-containing protein [Vibrio parahaemolyticus]|uniref:helix-turn-helix domain-containing protein n=1 Tax=Vibrio parahaemolyticus TaxID=670 RepID=UPI0015D2B12C|nr:helix-turn-helix domain-containing protein [Vibrio parahaemolyticus]NYU23874.1 hypothetical protein [Vibrio parahaemolyticus]